MAKSQGTKAARGTGGKARTRTAGSAAGKRKSTSSQRPVASPATSGDPSLDVLHGAAKSVIYSAFTRRLRTMN